MSGFSADWLRLRETADHAARDNAVTRKLMDWARDQSSLGVLDLGTGTGSNLRFLAPLLGQDQHWRLLDHDPALLAALPERLRQWAAGNGYRFDDSHELCIEGDGFSARIECRSADLAGGIGHHLDTSTQLVTASALLDLVSADWIDQLVVDCKTRGCAACFALNYDGQVQWQPAVPDDGLMAQRLNAHQHQAKGLGVALGPAAGAATAERLLSGGLDVTRVPSNWQLSHQEADLQIALAQGWVEAVVEQDPALTELARRWLTLRTEAAHTTGTHVSVGHLDVLGLPQPDSST